MSDEKKNQSGNVNVIIFPVWLGESAKVMIFMSHMLFLVSTPAAKRKLPKYTWIYLSHSWLQSCDASQLLYICFCFVTDGKEICASFGNNLNGEMMYARLMKLDLHVMTYKRAEPLLWWYLVLFDFSIWANTGIFIMEWAFSLLIKATLTHSHKITDTSSVLKTMRKPADHANTPCPTLLPSLTVSGLGMT